MEIVKLLLKLMMFTLKTKRRTENRVQSENTITLTGNRISPPLDHRPICLLGGQGFERSEVVDSDQFVYVTLIQYRANELYACLIFIHI